ncbi:InlB B-repeat-containing protein [Candidatus Saccharibacteria bacterium]|nr:InlB B-repeat-containing protein [Candidatus Saccharibacteria bacterium]
MKYRDRAHLIWAKNTKHFVGALGLAGLLVSALAGSAAVLGPSVAYADTVDPSASTAVDVNVYVDPVISIRALDSTGTTDITAVNVDVIPTDTGAFAKNNFLLQVDSTNATGYDLYASSDYKTDGTTSETDPATTATYTNALVNLTQSDTISTLAATQTSPITEANFSATSSTYQNQWGMSKAWNETISGTALSGGNLANYFGVPVYGATITLRDDVDTAAYNSRTSIGVGVNVNTAKKAGTYRNQFVFTAVGNPLPVDYTLTFDKNTSDTVANLPAPMTDTVIAQSKTFTIPNTTPTRDGYDFVGWSTSATARQGSGSGPDGLYVAGDSFTVLSDDQSGSGTTTRFTGSATLYAIWEEHIEDFWSITTMQEMTWEICQSVHYPDATTATNTDNLVTDKATYKSKNITSDGTTPWVPTRTLIDDRDADGTGTKRSYTVSRLADGNCWMTENLKYDLRGLYNNGKRGIGSKNDGSTFEMTDANLGSGVSYYTTSADFNYVITPNTTSANVTRYNAQIGDTSGTEYYYTWSGATAGQGGTNDSSSGVAIDGSICPAGWRLPTYSGTYSYQTLYNSYNSVAKWEQYPATFLRVGYFNSGSQTYSSNGYYWSASVSNANFAYYMNYYTGDVYPREDLIKFLGFSVRCVASRS